MKIFKLSKNIDVVCNSENTRYGFRHLATLHFNGIERENAKACYYNRTWECYQYQSVLKSVIEKALKSKEIDQKQYNKFYKKIDTALNW